MSTSPTWTVEILWFADGNIVLEGTATFDALPGVDDNSIDLYASAVAHCIMRTDAWGRKRLAELNDTYDRRRTTVTLSNGKRSRSVAVVDDRMGMKEEEAERCANHVMDWLYAPETTEMLTACPSGSRRR